MPASREYYTPAEQRRNRLVHACYLLGGTFPPGVEFDMAFWSDETHIGGATTCGSCGCAVGFAPFAGLGKDPDERWSSYSSRVFGLDDLDRGEQAWDWCFSPLWDVVDNTPPGAGQRLLWLELHGVPEGWDERIVIAPLCYTHLTLADAEATLAALGTATTDAHGSITCAKD